jgi:small-conductance mechanosensitive channel
MWGDKCKVLENKAKHIRHELSKGDSATIDTELRELARWLKDDFKDPYPAWKYPITSVEQFADSSIVVAVKFYVDNVRLDKFMRPFATYAQFRQRIVERFENEHITIPFPQRDVHFDEPHYVDPRAPQRDL